MAHSIKGMQKALSQFRFNSSLDDTSKKQIFGHLVDSIRARVAADPLQALNELSDTYNTIVNKKLTLKVDKNPTVATRQENIVLHALQTMYKQNLDRYLRDLYGKSESEKRTAIEALESNHKKIINQKTEGIATFNIKQVLQAISPRAIMPTQIKHAPSDSGLKWQDNTLVQTVQNDTASDPERSKLAIAFERNVHSASDLAKGLQEKTALQVKSMLLQKNGLATEKVEKLVRAAQMVIDVDEESTDILNFLGGAVEQYYQVLVLKAELEGTGNTQTAKHLATKAEEMHHELTKATRNSDAGIAKKAVNALKLVDLMNSIPILSQKYKTLKLALVTASNGPDIKTQISIHDQIDKIEDQLREAAKHSDARIKIPAKVALETNQISEKAAFKFKKGELHKENKQPAMLIMAIALK